MQPQLILEDTIYTLEQLHNVEAPQIALAGRSNVGKSSLINALAGRKKLARISATPGKTQSINYYRVEPWGFYLVDLPGYGYAKASKSDREKWAKLINAYLTSTPSLKALAVLLDCRIPPQKLDVDLTAYARSIHIPLLPILTKADKCKQKERVAKQSEWARLLEGVKPIISSSSSGLGINSIWEAMRLHVGGPQEEESAEAPSPVE
ncbi:MAG: ribosome biogenesis GTP-binding protein YihA/YsxC [Halodesulfovibrio sp.]